MLGIAYHLTYTVWRPQAKWRLCHVAWYELRTHSMDWACFVFNLAAVLNFFLRPCFLFYFADLILDLALTSCRLVSKRVLSSCQPCLSFIFGLGLVPPEGEP